MSLCHSKKLDLESLSDSTIDIFHKLPIAEIRLELNRTLMVQPYQCLVEFVDQPLALDLRQLRSVIENIK